MVAYTRLKISLWVGLKNKMYDFETALWVAIPIICVLIFPAVASRIAANKKNNAKSEREQKARYKEEKEALLQIIVSELRVDKNIFNPNFYIRRSSCKNVDLVKGFNLQKYFTKTPSKLDNFEQTLLGMQNIKRKLEAFLSERLTDYVENLAFTEVRSMINVAIQNLSKIVLVVSCASPAGQTSYSRRFDITIDTIKYFKDHPQLIMSKSQLASIEREENKRKLAKKKEDLFDLINRTIDFANQSKYSLVSKKDIKELDAEIQKFFNGVINTIKKIKEPNSEEWEPVTKYIFNINAKINSIIQHNSEVLDYYESEDFLRLKNVYDSLYKSQREFNDYIDKKINTISSLFGKAVCRDETVNSDAYNTIRPYRKTVTPFTAEVSAAVFASAENNPIDYIIKIFYPNKQDYPIQIQKLHTFIEDVEMLKDAKKIIDNYKVEFSKYIEEVPDFILAEDRDGFYSRLGFADITEDSLNVEYKFTYTSNGGYAQRSFAVPMTENTVVELIKRLENKLTFAEFKKEQRCMMTKKLREFIKQRDNYTCKCCGNSTYKEPNLLLEIDHIIPVAKGGVTEANNLQTLCWRCNRSKSDKLM